MADITPRISWQNWSQLSASVLTVDSEEVGWPRAWLKDPLRSKVWRTKVGWQVTTGFNNKLDIWEKVATSSSGYGVSTVTLSSGNYVSGTSYATHVETLLNACTTLKNTYEVDYASTSGKFTINAIATAVQDSNGVYSLLWSTGSNAGASIGYDLGFNVAADSSNWTTGSTALRDFTSTSATYQSKHFAKFDMASARDVQVIFLHYNNVDTTAGSVKVQANASDAWATPSISTSMAGTYLWNTWASSTWSYRYWRFVIENREEEAGYTYAGVPFIGEYLQPDPGLSARYAEKYNQLSAIGFADQGAPFLEEKDGGKGYTWTWVGLTANEKNKLKQAGEFLKIGRPFFFSLDPQNDPDDVTYVLLTQGMNIQRIPSTHWQVTMQAEEVLG